MRARRGSQASSKRSTRDPEAEANGSTGAGPTPPTTKSAGPLPKLSFWAFLIVAAAALLPYLALPSNPFTGDAIRTVEQNPVVLGGSLGDLLLSDFWGLPMDHPAGTRSWRPLVSLTYALQARFSGVSPAPFHRGDMLLHVAASIVLLLLLRELLRSLLWSTLAAALFATHPLLTEAVCSVYGRADMMASLCLFLALLLHLQAARSARPVLREAAAVVLLFLAMLCKEYAVVFPFLVIVLDLLRAAVTGSVAASPGAPDRLRPGDRRRADDARHAGLARWLPVWVGGLAAAGLYLGLRVWLTGDIGGVPMLGEGDHPLVGASFGVRAGTAVMLLLHAMRLVVVPVGLTHMYGFGTVTIAAGLSDPTVLAALGVLALLGAMAVYALLRGGEWVPLFALALFLVPLVPGLNLVSVSGVLFAERFLYAPVAAACLLAGWCLSRLPASAPDVIHVRGDHAASHATSAEAGKPGRRGRAAGPATKTPGTAARFGAAVCVAVFLLFAALTFTRVRDWQSTQRLAEATLRSYPDAANALNELGAAFGTQGRFDEAAPLLERAVSSAPGNPEIRRNYAVALLQLGRFEEAIAAWRRTIDLAPTESGALYRGLGKAEFGAGRFEDAVVSLRRAHELSPEDTDVTSLLAQALQRAAVEIDGKGDHAGAAALFRELTALDPGRAHAWFNLGRCLYLAGRPGEAIEPLQRGLALVEDPKARALLDRARLESAGSGLR